MKTSSVVYFISLWPKQTMTSQRIFKRTEKKIEKSSVAAFDHKYMK